MEDVIIIAVAHWHYGLSYILSYVLSQASNNG